MHPQKLNMETENDGFQRESPFSRGWFAGSMLNFSGGKCKPTTQPVDVLNGWKIHLCQLSHWEMSHNKKSSNPIGSMYGIYTYIYHKNQPNVSKYTIHGSSGNLSGRWNPIGIPQFFSGISLLALQEETLQAPEAYGRGWILSKTSATTATAETGHLG